MGLKRQPELKIPVEHGVDEIPRSGQYRPDYPRKPFASEEQACQWVRVRRLVQPPAPSQRHQIRDTSSATQRIDIAIFKQRAEVYEKARRANPTR